MANIILITTGTLGGDLFPVIHVGCLLKERGHAVSVITHHRYSNEVEQAGLKFIALDTPEIYAGIVADSAMMNTPKGMIAFYRQRIIPQLLPQYEILNRCCQQEDTILIAAFNTHLVAQMVAEKLQVPYLSIFLAPGFLLNERFSIELHSALSPEINACRAQVGLPAINNWMNWFRSADKKLAFWPEWFAQRDSSWASGVKTFNFLMNDKMESGELPPDAELILTSGPAPIFITHGTSAPGTANFFSASIDACEQLNYPAILVTNHEACVPANLPPNVHWFRDLPPVNLMPRVGAVIHHGGIGTLARSLWAGTPQIVLAAGFDRPDNAKRLQTAGVAKHLSPSQWTAKDIAQAIKDVTESADIREKCDYFKETFHAEKTWTDLCLEIEGSLKSNTSITEKNQPAVLKPSDSISVSNENKLNDLTKNLSAKQLALLAKLAKEKGKARANGEVASGDTQLGILDENKSTASAKNLSPKQLAVLTKLAKEKSNARKANGEIDTNERREIQANSAHPSKTKLAINGGTPLIAKNTIKPWPPIDEIDQKMVLSSLMGDNHAFGPNCRALQKEFAAWNGNQYAITTNSGTAALHMAIAACDCGVGDEIIVTAYSWSSSATCILQHNCIPVFVDIDFETMLIDVNKIEQAITPRTKAIIAVHLHGLPLDMDAILAIAKKYNLKVIEDACQAYGATYKGKKTGLWGDCAAFSMNQNKSLSSGEGGLFVTDNFEILQKAQSLWSFGETATPSQKRDYHAHSMGWMYRNNDLTAAFGRAQLTKLDGYLRRQTDSAQILTEKLAGIPGLILPTEPSDCKSNYYNYVIRFDMDYLGHTADARTFRDKINIAMQAEGVDSLVWQHFILPAMTVFQAKNAYGRGCPWACSFYGGTVNYSVEQYPMAIKHCDTHITLMTPLRSPNDDRAAILTAEGIVKVMENIDQVEMIQNRI